MIFIVVIILFLSSAANYKKCFPFVSAQSNIGPASSGYKTLSTGGGTGTCQENYLEHRTVCVDSQDPGQASAVQCCSLELADVAARLEGVGYYQCSYYGEHD